ncbi:hypothetical protein GCM10027347_56460 [Larkinella harenae]
MVYFTLYRLLKRYFYWIVGLPAVAACTVFVLTRDAPKQYSSTATIYSSLAGATFSLSTEDRKSYDQYYSANVFDNLLTTIRSRETIGQVGRRLLAQHLLLNQANPTIVGKPGFVRLNTIVSDSLRQQIVVPGDYHRTYARLDSLYWLPSDNPLKKLLRNSAFYYSIAYINRNLKVERKETSDILEFSYGSDDPAVSQQTLSLVIDVFKDRYTEIKSAEARAVVQYYERKFIATRDRLYKAEELLRDFGANHDIINYAEQTRNVAASREVLESDFYKETMRLEATKAALSSLEKRMTNNATLLSTNDELLVKRSELTDAQSQLASAEVTGAARNVVDQLHKRTNLLADELKSMARKYYNVNNTIESLPQHAMVDEWLVKMIEYEESAARFNTYQDVLNTYDEKSRKMAPLGSRLNHFEFKVQLAQKEYATVRDHLNQARIKQKNAEISGPPMVLDPPIYPQEPQPSKRGMQIGGAFLAVFFLTMLVVSMREYFNHTIQSPVRAEQLTHTTLAAAFPLIPGRYSNRLRYIKRCMLEQLRSVVTVELGRLSRRNAHLIILASTRPNQGKSWIGDALSEHYALAGSRVLYLKPEGHNLLDTNLLTRPLDDTALVNVHFYPINSTFIDASDITQFVHNNAASDNPYDYIFLELPSLMEAAIPAHLVYQSSLSLLVMDAQSVWTKTDQSLCTLYQKASGGNVKCVLNRVDMGLMDSLPQMTPVSASQTVPQVAINYEG